MNLGIDLNADKKVRDLILSWRISTRFILVAMALLVVPHIARFVYQRLYFLTNPNFLYFWFLNARFGGFFLLVFFLIWKRGETADIILASPAKYPRIGISNIWLRVLIYLTVIIGFGFAAHGFRILIGMTNAPFVFPADIFDFLNITLFAPLSEEMYYRFLILYITASLFGRIPAIFISTFFFTASHYTLQFSDLSWVAFVGLANALLTIAYGTLWPAIGIHMLNNIVSYLNHPF